MVSIENSYGKSPSVSIERSHRYEQDRLHPVCTVYALPVWLSGVHTEFDAYTRTRPCAVASPCTTMSRESVSTHRKGRIRRQNMSAAVALLVVVHSRSLYGRLGHLDILPAPGRHVAARRVTRVRRHPLPSDWSPSMHGVLHRMMVHIIAGVVTADSARAPVRRHHANQ